MLLAAVLIATATFAKEPVQTPKAGDAFSSEAAKLPSSQTAPVPQLPRPSSSKPDLNPQSTGTGKVPLPPGGTGMQRVPIHDHLPIHDPARRIVPLSPLPPARIRGTEGVLGAMSHMLSIDGLTERVDLRDRAPADARLAWRLEGSDSVLFIVRRAPGGGCPSAGTSLDLASRQWGSDPSLIHMLRREFNAHGNRPIRLSGSSYYEGLTDIYVQACGTRGDTLNGVATNVVHVQLGSFRRFPASTWSVEWSLDTSANTACTFGGLDTSAIPPPPAGRLPVGFVSSIRRGADPFPCIRDDLYQYQSTASFDLTGLQREARIVRAELQFTEADVEGWDRSLCTNAVRSIGLATSPVRAGIHHVGTVSGRADDARSPAGSGSRRTMDVTDWVRAWQTGSRAAAVTFLGRPPRREGAACKSDLFSVNIVVDYE